jgi:ubiquitin C-terminal hydrolase
LNKNEINNINNFKIFLTEKCSELKCNNILSKISFKNKKTKIYKRQIINKYPEIFVIRIEKIVSYNNDYGTQIANNQSDILFELNINEDNKQIKYELYSFLQHMGSTDYGHYISSKKFSKEMWVIVNDSEFQKVDKDKIKNMDPYILFYRRL